MPVCQIGGLLRPGRGRQGRRISGQGWRCRLPWLRRQGGLLGRRRVLRWLRWGVRSGLGGRLLIPLLLVVLLVVWVMIGTVGLAVLVPSAAQEHAGRRPA